MKKNTVNHTEAIAPSELIITPAGAIYHLGIRPDQLAHKIIVVGDQYRVAKISKHFDTIEHQESKREFVTHTGTYNGKIVTAMSTGIGCDNIDIVLNELDALVNIDFETRLPKDEFTSLEIVRLGTSGSLQSEIPVDTFVASSHGLGFDGLMGYYDASELYSEEEEKLKEASLNQVRWPKNANSPYFVEADKELVNRIGSDMTMGITATANGFYGPQGRSLRLAAAVPDLNEQLSEFSYNDDRITNFEMETSALYGLGAMMGHKTATVCAIIANRFTKTYSEDYQKPVEELIKVVLDRI